VTTAGIEIFKTLEGPLDAPVLAEFPAPTRKRQQQAGEEQAGAPCHEGEKDDCDDGGAGKASASGSAATRGVLTWEAIPVTAPAPCPQSLIVNAELAAALRSMVQLRDQDLSVRLSFASVNKQPNHGHFKKAVDGKGAASRSPHTRATCEMAVPLILTVVCMAVQSWTSQLI
jgi:hypothetical protein